MSLIANLVLAFVFVTGATTAVAANVPTLDEKCGEPHLKEDGGLGGPWWKDIPPERRREFDALLDRELCRADALVTTVVKNRTKLCRREERLSACFLRAAESQQRERAATLFGGEYLSAYYLKLWLDEPHTGPEFERESDADFLLAEHRWLRERVSINDRLPVRADRFDALEKDWATDSCERLQKSYVRIAMRLKADPVAVYRAAELEHALADLRDCSAFIQRP